MAGILAHELAHIELKHVMMKVTREIGLSAIVSLTTGGGGNELSKKILKTLSSRAYDRKLEKQADLEATNYLINANIDPDHFAGFLYRVLSEQDTLLIHMALLSTHPAMEERIENIAQATIRRSISPIPILHPDSWQALQDELRK